MKKIPQNFLKIIGCAGLLTLGVLSVNAQEEPLPHWYSYVADGEAALVYGVPESDYILLTFLCAVGEPIIKVYVQDEQSQAKAGDLLKVSITAGGERIVFSEKALANEDSGGKDVEGRLPLNTTLRQILTAEGQLEVVIDGHVQHYDMKGSAKPVATLLGACGVSDSSGKSL